MGHNKQKPDVDTLIDSNLKRVYDSVLAEDVPDRFAELLTQLQAGEEGTVPPDPSRTAAPSDDAED